MLLHPGSIWCVVVLLVGTVSVKMEQLYTHVLSVYRTACCGSGRERAFVRGPKPEQEGESVAEGG